MTRAHLAVWCVTSHFIFASKVLNATWKDLQTSLKCASWLVCVSRKTWKAPASRTCNTWGSKLLCRLTFETQSNRFLGVEISRSCFFVFPGAWVTRYLRIRLNFNCGFSSVWRSGQRYTFQYCKIPIRISTGLHIETLLLAAPNLLSLKALKSSSSRICYPKLPTHL